MKDDLLAVTFNYMGKRIKPRLFKVNAHMWECISDAGKFSSRALGFTPERAYKEWARHTQDRIEGRIV